MKMYVYVLKSLTINILLAAEHFSSINNPFTAGKGDSYANNMR